MSAIIQEIRSDVLAQAVKFAAGCGCRLRPGHVQPSLSLVACEGDTIVGVLICVEQRYRHRIELGYPQEGISPELERDLIGKAMMKLRAAGIRTCDLVTNGGPSTSTFWGGVSWLGQALGDAA